MGMESLKNGEMGHCVISAADQGGRLTQVPSGTIMD